MKELKISLFGRVQGVNLRRRLTKYAESLRVKGYVENREDGSVFCLAQGNEESLEELLRWCQKESFPAKLTGMSFEWNEKIEKEYKKFELKKGDNILLDEAKSLIQLGKSIVNKEIENYPKHVVIIPDGNRRWAREKGWKAWIGHRRAMSKERIDEFFKKAFEYDVKYLSFWGFSTENWNRDKEELDTLWDIYRKISKSWKNALLEQDIRFRHFGRKDRLPQDILESMEELEEQTKNCKTLNFQFCLDYNGRDDVARAINKMLQDGITSVDEKTISQYLDTGLHIPDPDLIIRTSGEKRTSGIMAYQAAYAELYFTNVYFPDFGADDFERALLDFSARTRRFGGTHDKDLKNIKKENLVDPDKKLDISV